MLNRGAEDVTVAIDWNSLTFNDELSGREFNPEGYLARNLWDSQEKVRKVTDIKTLTIGTHDVAVYRLNR